VPGRSEGERAADRAAVLFPAAVAALVIGWSARPGVGVHDSGELAAAAYHLGVSHPAGSPLWLLLAKGASLLPLAGAPAYRMALLSVLASAATASLVAWFLLRNGVPPVPASAGGLAVVSLTRPFWAGTIVEVYALELTLAVLFVLAVRRAGDQPRDPGGAWLAGLAGGLLLSVHHALAPGVFAALATVWLTGANRSRRALPVAGGLALGLTPYLELPLRAFRHPAALWADTAALGGLWRHLTSAQYRAGGLAGGGGWDRLFDAMAVTGGPVPWLLLPLGAVGAVLLWRRSRLAAVALLALWAADLTAVVWLQAMPLDSEVYLVVASGMTGLAMALAAGLTARRRALAPLPVLLAVGLLVLSVHARSGRTVATARWTTARRLAAAPPGAVLWLRGDSVAFPAVYHWLVEGWRPDLTIMHPWGFVGAPWLPESIRSRPDDPAAREMRDGLARALESRAGTGGRAFLAQDRGALGVRRLGRGTLWTSRAAGRLPRAALVSPLPDERRWRYDADPTVRGLTQMDHLPLGFTATRTGRPEDARREAHLAADSRPSFATVHRALGQGWLDLDLLPESIIELRRAVALDPGVPEAWLALGVALVRRGDVSAARSAWIRAVDLEPGWAPPLVDLAHLAERRGDRLEALRWARRAAATGDAEGMAMATRLEQNDGP